MAHGTVNTAYFVSISPNEKCAVRKSEEEFADCCNVHNPDTNPNATVGVHTFDSPTGVREYTTLYLYPVDLTKADEGKYTKVKDSRRTWELDTTTPKSTTKDY